MESERAYCNQCSHAAARHGGQYAGTSADQRPAHCASKHGRQVRRHARRAASGQPAVPANQPSCACQPAKLRLAWLDGSSTRNWKSCRAGNTCVQSSYRRAEGVEQLQAGRASIEGSQAQSDRRCAAAGAANLCAAARQLTASLTPCLRHPRAHRAPPPPPHTQPPPCTRFHRSLRRTWFHTGARWWPAWLVSSSRRDCAGGAWVKS